MAIAYDNSSKSGYNGTTVSHIIGAGSNRILFVAVYAGNGSFSGGGVTYNGVAMTQYGTSFGSGVIFLFYMFNPPVGTANIVINYGSSMSSFAVAASYNGVAQSGFPDSVGQNTSNTSGSNSASQTVSTTVVAANCWVIGLSHGFGDFSTAATQSSTVTDRQDNTSSNGNASDGLIISDSNGTVPTGSYSITFTATISGQTVFCGGQGAFSIAPAAPSGLPSLPFIVKQAVNRAATFFEILIKGIKQWQDLVVHFQ